MRTSASIGSHPIHPMLIPFPIALWTFSLLADLIYVWGHQSPIWRDWIAFYALGAGIIGGVLAAVPGIVDYFSIKDPKVSKIAAWHARFNILALLVFAASFYLRTNNGSRMSVASFNAGGFYFSTCILLSALGVILISISGYLGGEMVYVHHVAVVPKPESATEDGTPDRSA
jgi:uncharacterized membrane protein